MKRLFAIFLSLLIVFQAPCVFFADNIDEQSEQEAYNEVLPVEMLGSNETCGDNLTWRVEKGVLTIEGKGEMDNWPTPYYPGWYSIRESITEVVIGNGVSTIGEWAFNNLCNLEKVTIPESVTMIGDGAISACTSLKSITIPDTVLSIGQSVFRQDTSLESIILSESITNIPEQTFYDCTSLTDVVLPDKVSAIGKKAFYNCTSIKSLSIPSGVTVLNEETFYNCAALEGIEIPQTVTKLNKSVFEGCSALKAVIIPSMVTQISVNAFLGCTSLKDVFIPEGVLSLENYAFKNCSSLEKISIPESVTSIKIGVFMGCTSLNEVNLPKNLKTLSSSAFSGCTALTDIEIPANITTIGDFVFSGCSKLENVKINKGFKKINSSMFYNCKALKSITIPGSVNYVGSYAFEGCSSLEQLICLTVDAQFKTDVFTGCSKLTVYGFEGSTAQTYAKTKKIPFVCLTSTFTDENTGVLIEGIVIYPDIKITVLDIADDDAIKLYDIKMEENSIVTQPDDVVKISIPVPKEVNPERCKIYRVASDGTLTDMKAEVIDGYFVFSTDRFGRYAIYDHTVPEFTGYSLTLDSEIYINFYMQLSEDAVKNGKMVFTVGKRTVNSEVQFNEANSRYYFNCPLNALEMAEKVTATFTYGNKTFEKKYLVENYIERILNGKDEKGNEYSDEMKMLARKIANYGHYAQIYLEEIHTNVTIGDGGYAEMENFGDEYDVNVKAATKVLKDNFEKPSMTNGISSLYGRTAYLDSATALNYYVTVDDGKAPTAVCEEKEVAIEKYTDKIYIVSVKDITATELDKKFTVTINGVDFVGSIFDYCGALIAKNGEDSKAARAMAALYEYYDAAVRYTATKK